MTDEAKKVMLRTMTGEVDDEVLSTYLSLAEQVVLERAFPFRTGEDPLPEKYHSIQVEIATFLLNKRGAEGENKHTENGVSRSYENGDIPYNLLRRITPMVGVI